MKKQKHKRKQKKQQELDSQTLTKLLVGIEIVKILLEIVKLLLN